MSAPSPPPTLEGVLNFRELGGLPASGGTVKHGQLYRSGHLAAATDTDLQTLRDLGITTIVDFRLEVDLAGDGGTDRIPEGARHVSVPVTDPGGRGAEIRETLMSGDPELMHQRYGDGKAHEMATVGAVAQAVDPHKHIAYRTFLQALSSTHQRPMLFHCSAGKDRAGWAATLVGMALGVADDHLVDHYVRSNVHRPPADRRAHYESMGLDVTVLMPFLGVHEDYLRAALAAVDERWSTREAYLDDALGFGGAQIDRLRSELLE